MRMVHLAFITVMTMWSIPAIAAERKELWGDGTSPLYVLPAESQSQKVPAAQAVVRGGRASKAGNLRERMGVVLPSIEHPQARYSSVHYAAAFETIHRVREEAIAAGLNFDAVDPHTGMTPLMCAAVHHRRDVVEFLLDERQKVDPNKTDLKGRNALMHALENFPRMSDLKECYDLSVIRLLVFVTNLEHMDAKGETARDKVVSIKYKTLSDVFTRLSRLGSM